MEVTQSFVLLLSEFQCCFTKPSFSIFVDIITGWVLSPRRRFITELIFSSGSVGKGHHSRYHNFFGKSVWVLDVLCKVLATMLVKILVPRGLIELAVDDTLARKRGLTVYGTGMHHDPLISSRAMKLVSWGHNWVVLCLILRNPFWAPGKVWSLPIAFRLYRNRQGVTKGQKKKAQNRKSKKAKGKQGTTKRRKQKQPKRQPNSTHRTRPELAVELIQMVSGWFADRELIVTGDSAYGGASVLQHVPENVHLISHVHPKGALYKPAPKAKPGQKGPPRKKGDRLPSMADWAEDNTKWKKLKFDQFGLHATLLVKTQKALYYKAGKDRLLLIILVRDAEGKRPDQMFYCTNLAWDARQVLSCYAGRWSIEVTFENCKQLLGFSDPANRKEKAVKRTAPFSMVVYSLVVLWFHQHGHKHLKFPNRPWYTRKVEPSFADLLTTLRCLTWREKFRTVLAQSGPFKKGIQQIINFLSLAA